MASRPPTSNHWSRRSTRNTLVCAPPWRGCYDTLCLSTSDNTGHLGAFRDIASAAHRPNLHRCDIVQAPICRPSPFWCSDNVLFPSFPRENDFGNRSIPGNDLEGLRTSIVRYEVNGKRDLVLDTYSPRAAANS